jgi:valyl-tRNA synthetase
MARLSSLVVAPKVDLPGAFHEHVGVAGLVVSLPRMELSADDQAKIRKEIAALDKDADGIGRKLADAAFLARAPEAVVEKVRRQLEELTARRGKLVANLGEGTVT